jgi:structural maintenance of chromosome 3 (chondroitin sulfate proteoglycan 6)
VFSYSNPYYIVKQGQINSIACCIEVDRLRVVREVVGTELYMEKKGAEEELAATDTIVTQVGDSLRKVADRLQQLGEEKEMLEQFMNVEEEDRGVNHCGGDMKEVAEREGVQKLNLVLGR